MFISVIGIVYGALVALVQPDIKKLVAYSSISHLGFVTLGLFAFNLQAVTGSVLQMINHGISTGALFLMIGILYDRRHTKDISEFGGLAKVIPWFSLFFLVFTLSSIGLPATNGFVGEFLILMGTFIQGHSLYRGSGAMVLMILAVIATSGVILSAYYMLKMVGRVIFGPLANAKNFSLKDISFGEAGYLLPLIILVFWIGIYPKPFTQIIETTGQAYLQTHIFERQGRASSMAALEEGGQK
jgi:NADH-quinone oxidoreductase subunit M